MKVDACKDASVEGTSKPPRPHCAYCAKEFPKKELTRDHVIPRALWAGRPLPENPILVPSCRPCQENLDREVSYFRDVFGAQAAVGNDVDDLGAVFDAGKIRRSILRDPRRQEEIRKGQRVPTISDFGFYTGLHLKTSCDASRLSSVPSKMAKGLLYAEQGHILSGNAIVKVDLKATRVNRWKKLPGDWKAFDPRVCQWQSFYDPNFPDCSQWVFLIYRRSLIYVSTFAAGLRDFRFECENPHCELKTHASVMNCWSNQAPSAGKSSHYNYSSWEF